MGDHLSMGTEFVGDHLSKGIDFMGIVCPGGQEVGDRKSWDLLGLGPNVLQPFFGCSIVCFKSEVILMHDCETLLLLEGSNTRLSILKVLL